MAARMTEPCLWRDYGSSHCGCASWSCCEAIRRMGVGALVHGSRDDLMRVLCGGRTTQTWCSAGRIDLLLKVVIFGVFFGCLRAVSGVGSRRLCRSLLNVLSVGKKCNGSSGRLGILGRALNRSSTFHPRLPSKPSRASVALPLRFWGQRGGSCLSVPSLARARSFHMPQWW